MRLWLALGSWLVALGCGSNPSGPTPITPQPIQVSGSLTDTVTGASLGSYSETVASLPALVTISRPGYLPRTAAIRSASQSVDLIPESFDLGFYRQLARNGHEAPTSLEPLRVLSQSPSLYLHRAGLSDATVALMEARARDIVSSLSGGRLHVVTIERGEEARPLQGGWITVTLINDPADTACGRATVGAAAGNVRLNMAHPSTCTRPIYDTLGHEIGHALGFWHADGDSHLMKNGRPRSHSGLPSAAERAAGAVAYARQSGNRDVDVDTLTASLFAPIVSD